MEIPTGESVAGEASSKDGVTVHFQSADSAEGAPLESAVCSLHDSVGVVRERLAASRGIQQAGSISLSYQGETLSSSTVIDELSVRAGQELTLLVHLITPTKHEEEEAPTNQVPSEGAPTNQSGVAMATSSHRMPDVFTVVVEAGEKKREVLIRLERPRVGKPYLGGYRHKLSGVEYHHANSQTTAKRREDNGIPKFERDTQTIVSKNRPQQVTVDAATQMNKTGCFINTRQDRVILPSGRYETADDFHKRVLEKVILLQCYWRRWLAARYVRALRSEKLARAQWEREEAERVQREREERARREFERRLNPRTKEDFDLLYHALEMWRQDELKHINATTSGAERKAALCALLEQEAQLIASIGRHQIVAGEDNKEKMIRRFLDATSAPKRWIAFDGNTTEMNTPFTLRATQLKDIYTSITLTNLSRDERLDVLLTLKCTVKEHDCKLTREIVDLVDREADLLVRGMGEQALQGLRKRISTLFFQYCKTPLFNSEAAKHIKVPQDVTKLRTNVYYCRSCCQYLPSTDFELSTNARVVGHCRACRDLDNQARAREDFTLYRAMLRALRKSEENFKDNSQIVFLVQEPDLRYLVENIWGGQSVLSANRELFELSLARWDRRQQWAPWNCVLITREEAKAHYKLDSLPESYGAQLIHKVQHRHVLARSYFSRIPEMADQMKSKVEDLPLPRPKEREIVIKQHQQTNTEQQTQQTTVEVN